MSYSSRFAGARTRLQNALPLPLLTGESKDKNVVMAISKEFFSSPAFKLILLTGMVLQNSATVLVGRYTRSSVPKEDLYVVNHLILITEIGKLVLSLLFEHFSTSGKLMESIKANILDAPYDALKIMVPALLYLVQNSLLYVALSNLTAPLFQVTYQGKLVTTAMVSVVMLNRKYSLQQWICLVTLSIGVAIVVLGESSNDPPKVPTGEQSLAKGLMAVIIACMSSALAGVYFEKVVKTAGSETKAQVSVWMRNVQLAFFTICTAFLQGLWSGGSKASDVDVSSKPYFHGFTNWVWVLVFLQAGGGLLVAAVIKYADNVLKGLATGVSVCFATGVSTVLFGTPLSGQFTLGAALILVSVYFFSNPMNKKSSTPSSNTEMKPILPK